MLQAVEFLIMKNKAINSDSVGGSKTGAGDNADEIEIVNLAARSTWLTPLHLAVRYGLFSLVDLLLDHGADINAVGDGDVMPLGLALKLQDHLAERVFAAENDTTIATQDRVQEVLWSEATATAGEADGGLGASSPQIEALREASGVADHLVRKLRALGARETWRRQTGQTALTAVAAAALASNVFSTATAGAEAVVEPEAEARVAAPKKKMVRGFAGTVDKATTPTVDETMALLRIQVMKEREEAAVAAAADVEVTQAADGDTTVAANQEEAVAASASASDASWYETDDGAQIFSTGN